MGLTFFTASVSWNHALGILSSYCPNQVHFYYSFATYSFLFFFFSLLIHLMDDTEKQLPFLFPPNAFLTRSRQFVMTRLLLNNSSLNTLGNVLPKKKLGLVLWQLIVTISYAKFPFSFVCKSLTRVLILSQHWYCLSS